MRNLYNLCCTNVVSMKVTQVARLEVIMIFYPMLACMQPYGTCTLFFSVFLSGQLFHELSDTACIIIAYAWDMPGSRVKQYW